MEFVMFFVFFFTQSDAPFLQINLGYLNVLQHRYMYLNVATPLVFLTMMLLL